MGEKREDLKERVATAEKIEREKEKEIGNEREGCHKRGVTYKRVM